MPDPFNRPGKPDPWRNLERIADALEKIVAAIHRQSERAIPADDPRAPTSGVRALTAAEVEECVEAASNAGGYGVVYHEQIQTLVADVAHWLAGDETDRGWASSRRRAALAKASEILSRNPVRP